MNISKKIISSILIILVFFSLLIPTTSQASIFDDDEDKAQSEIEETIDNDDGGLFEKIIAKLIGGIAATIFDLTTNENFGMGFKNYDELIFAKDSTVITPFTDEQWTSMMSWYKIMSSIVGSIILIAVVVVAYKLIVSGYSIEKRTEAKDSIMRLFFGAVAIVFAPLFVKFLLFLNNNLVQMIVGYTNGSLDELLGNGVVTNIQTGNAIATAIVIALFAYLFFKLNVKFIIRQFTILVFLLFTPVVAVMWMINKRTIGAAIWFGQILMNVFMQFIYAFLFLIYMEFLPQSGGWATSILWAMMILPIADALQNTLQNLVSRIAGVNNDELANRGMGMAGAMAYSIKTIAYQFKGSESQVNNNNQTSLLGRIFNSDEVSPITSMKTTPMETSKMITTPINTSNTDSLQEKENKNNLQTEESSKKNSDIASMGKKAFNTGKEFLNMGMYVAEGKNFDTRRNYNRSNINDTRKEDFEKYDNENSTIINIQEDDDI
ncbi:MAG: hypothetical protein KH434_07100 [Clostridium sp.]|nr:hypothetical protein [Clostridium sp.]